VSETTATNQQEKAAKTKRKPEQESVLQHTFAAVRHNTGDRPAEDHQAGNFLQRAAVNSIFAEAEPSDRAERQTFADLPAGYDFSRVPTHTLTLQNKQLVQPNLMVNAPGDQYEQEAERVADEVMAMPAPSVPLQMASLDNWLNPGPAVGRLPAITRVQASGDGAFEVSPEVETNINQMRGGGQALPAEERSFFESRMGYDFSNVRVHTDTKAVQTSQALTAHAFTVGSDIAFNQGAYQPGTDAGRHLLAHELTHVVQQGAAGVQGKQRRGGLGGISEKSEVLRYLQRLGEDAEAEERALYRQEIAEFQRQNSPEKIAAHQQRILELHRSVDIRQRDHSQTLRRNGNGDLPEKTVTINVTNLHGGSGSATGALNFGNTKVYNQAKVKLQKGKEKTLDEKESKKILGDDLILDEFTDPDSPTDEEKALFKVNQTSGAVTMYYVQKLSDGHTGEAFIPSGSAGFVGFVVSNDGSNQTFSHELGHVLLDNGHNTDGKNLMDPVIGDDKTQLTDAQVTKIRSSSYAK
jgi:hypothetical protein